MTDIEEEKDGRRINAQKRKTDKADKEIQKDELIRIKSYVL